MRCWLVCAFALAGCVDAVTTEPVTYDDRHPEAVLDVVTSAKRGAAAVMYVHGGSWRGGSRGAEAGVVEQLARAGYVMLNVDYRLVPDGTFPAAVDDVFCALAWLQAHVDELGVDPARIAVMGYSAGGHLTGLLATATDVPALQDSTCPWGRAVAPAAMLSAAGPMDLPTLSTGEIVEEFVGVPFDENPAQWALASPVTHVTGDDPPFFFVHAEHDLIVPVEQSEQMAQTLRAAGVRADVLRLEGGGHFLSDGAGLGTEQLEGPFDTGEAAMALFDFLERTIGAP